MSSATKFDWKLKFLIAFAGLSFLGLIGSLTGINDNTSNSTSNEIENKNVTKSLGIQLLEKIEGKKEKKNTSKNISGDKLTIWKSAKSSDKDYTAQIIVDTLLKNGLIDKNKIGGNPKKEIKDCLDSFVKASNNAIISTQDVSSVGMMCAFQMGWK